MKPGDHAYTLTFEDAIKIFIVISCDKDGKPQEAVQIMPPTKTVQDISKEEIYPTRKDALKVIKQHLMWKKEDIVETLDKQITAVEREIQSADD